MPLVNNVVLKVNNGSSIPIRTTDRFVEKPCLDSKKPLQKNSSRNLLNLSKLRKVTEPPNTRYCFLNCHSLNEKSRPASVVYLILENSIQCLCLCETWLGVDEQKNRAVLKRALPDEYSILHVPLQPEEVVLVSFSMVNTK